MARFFMAGTNLEGGMAYIRGRDAEHVKVLRLRPGEDVVICDGRARITSATSSNPTGRRPPSRWWR
jgi:16S rRNA U1498 N3-methylase RsmE